LWKTSFSSCALLTYPTSLLSWVYSFSTSTVSFCKLLSNAKNKALKSFFLSKSLFIIRISLYQRVLVFVIPALFDISLFKMEQPSSSSLPLLSRRFGVYIHDSKRLRVMFQKTGKIKNRRVRNILSPSLPCFYAHRSDYRKQAHKCY